MNQIIINPPAQEEDMWEMGELGQSGLRPMDEWTTLA